MIPLFTSIQQDLKSFLEALTGDDIRGKIHPSTFYKGQVYQQEGRVEEVHYSGDRNRLSASVAGSLDYGVSLELKQGDIWADCSCPVDGLCKHLAAVLLYVVQNKGAIEVAESREPGSRPPEGRVAEHLASLSREELTALVMKYAPEDFFIEINNRYSGEAEALNTYHKVMAAIRKLFRDTELLYEPDAFGEALVKQLQRLLGLEQQLQPILSEFIFFIIRAVDNAFDEGYLYDSYSDASLEEPEEFHRLVENYTRILPYPEKTRFLQELDEILHDVSYVTFDSLANLAQDIFSESDLPALKAMLLSRYQELPPSLSEQYYMLVGSLLTDSEKERLLLYLKEVNTRSWLPELIELYRKQEREMEAIRVIRDSIPAFDGWYTYENIFFLYLDLLKSQNMELDAACVEAVNHCPRSSMLEKAAEVTGGKTERYEHIVEQKNPAELLNFLEKKGRLAEALSLLKRSSPIWDDRRFAFYKAHKKEFPAEAMDYFYETLDKHLQHTGNRHYHAIAETLEEILQVDPSRAKELAADIRSNYHRRRNLLALLRNF